MWLCSVFSWIWSVIRRNVRRPWRQVDWFRVRYVMPSLMLCWCYLLDIKFAVCMSVCVFGCIYSETAEWIYLQFCILYLSHHRHRALAAAIWQVPPDWKQPAGRPSHTWLGAIEADLGPRNFDLATAWRKATTWDEWRHIVFVVCSERRRRYM